MAVARRRRKTASSGRRFRRIHAASAVGAALAFGIVAQGALAFINEPPAFPRLLTMFPDRDFVSVEGLQSGQQYTFRATRNGVTIGTSEAGTADRAGIFEVNHPGGVCWAGSTPNLIAGDRVIVTKVGDPADSGDAGTIVKLSGTAAFEDGLGRIIVHGSANNGPGGTIDLASMEQRIVNPDFVALGLKRDIRAIQGGVYPDGDLTVDAVDNPNGDRWTAIYTGLTPDQRAAAVAGQTRVLGWQRVDALGNRLGISIYEVGELGGPGIGGCPAASDYAVTASDHAAITKAMKDDPTSTLTFSGVSQNASAVQVTLSDGTHTVVAPMTTLPAGGAQTWSVTFGHALLDQLSDGTLTAHGSYTVPDPVDPTLTTTITGVDKTIVKDTVAPGDPGATPAAGTYAISQAVTLHGADPAAKIHFTVNDTDPTASSPIAPAQINVTSSLTIRAIAIDPVGNPSGLASFAYVISAPVAPLAGGGGTSAATTTLGTIGSSVGAIASSARPALALKKFGFAPRVKQRKAQKQGLRFSMQLPDGTEIVKINIYRKTSKGLKLLSSGYKAPTSVGLYRVTQGHPGLRRLLNRGSYQVQVTPGYSKSELGKTSKAAFKVV